jgi:hypothetical protein
MPKRAGRQDSGDGRAGADNPHRETVASLVEPVGFDAASPNSQSRGTSRFCMAAPQSGQETTDVAATTRYEHREHSKYPMNERRCRIA